MSLTDQTADHDQGSPSLLDKAPGRIGRVDLVVRDLDRTRRFYEETIGLAPMGREGPTLHLGAGGPALLSLTHEPDADAPAPGSAGLFHTAFLLPSRRQLGAWLDHAMRRGVVLEGASDHRVSEALYLRDPEGNGVEVYADRPSETWTVIDDLVRMGSERLDLRELMRAKYRPWSGMPSDGCIGHVHLQVGDLALADRFYATLLGFQANELVPSARFYGMGGYHHQFAANIWRSAGAGPRKPGSTGLAGFEILMRDAACLTALRATVRSIREDTREDGGDLILRDPWNTSVRVRSALGQANPL
ncbi:VOC family protein [Methylobacterium trifolii]|uniref:Catechol-2,3-dioxygenase n=1 Tax=Methylobacterium trifolii TaxID=1003092 RepID=A0ABQ4TZT1_9HYPH|nr:VOC family protein [Methylobacterium trifolii]GJE60764.1 Catechol-2,3-dioxygenase [Methylobacterium trifolii]